MFKEALKILVEPFDYFMHRIQEDNMQLLTLNFVRYIHFISKRMICKLQTKLSKVDVVNNAWKRTLFILIKEATRIKDYGMHKLLKKIIEVRPDVKKYVIRKYIEQCNMKYLIALMEWRLLFSKMRRENNS